jgi:ABC-type uncharacterized transport system permease subunit
MKAKKKAILLTLPCIIALTGFFIIPLLYVFVKGLVTEQLTYYIKFCTDPFYMSILGSTS